MVIYGILNTSFRNLRITMSQLQKINTGLLIGLFLFLSGCGQKGDLYLPGQKDAGLDQTHQYQIS